MNPPYPKDTIYFWKTSDPFGCFSNFAPYSFKDKNGLYWLTSEHFYQAYKFKPGSKVFEEIRLKPPPKSAKIWAYANSASLLPDWEQHKISVMELALLLKFDQNEFCKNKLQESGNRVLVEASPKDAYWGYGPDGLGQNMLGKLLMELRSFYFSPK